MCLHISQSLCLAKIVPDTSYFEGANQKSRVKGKQAVWGKGKMDKYIILNTWGLSLSSQRTFLTVQFRKSPDSYCVYTDFTTLQCVEEGRREGVTYFNLTEVSPFDSYHIS